MCVRNSNSWVEMFEKDFLEYAGAKNLSPLPVQRLIADDTDAYIEEANRLAASLDAWIEKSELQKNLAGEFFFDQNRMYEEHIGQIKQFIAAI